jgi:hypothetical protein
LVFGLVPVLVEVVIGFVDQFVVFYRKSILLEVPHSFSAVGCETAGVWQPVVGFRDLPGGIVVLMASANPVVMSGWGSGIECSLDQ